jgi:hypothetical protein
MMKVIARCTRSRPVAIRLLCLTASGALCGSCASLSTPTTQPAASLTSLSESVEPLREAFNATSGRYRFVALLSPT